MKKIVCILMPFFILMACEPRVDIDLSQWGDKALITNVEIVKLETNDQAKLQEWYQNEVPVLLTQARIITISIGKSVVDTKNFVDSVTVNPAEAGNLNFAAFRIYHQGTKVEPVGDSPKPGVIADLTKKSFIYRIYSADGKTHDWKIIIK